MLVSLAFEFGQVGVCILAEAGAGGPGLPALVERATEISPARMLDLAVVACGSDLCPRAEACDQPHRSPQDCAWVRRSCVRWRAARGSDMNRTVAPGRRPRSRCGPPPHSRAPTPRPDRPGPPRPARSAARRACASSTPSWRAGRPRRSAAPPHAGSGSDGAGGARPAGPWRPPCGSGAGRR